MKYEVGDKIIVLHSREEGRVIDIINDQMVMIEVRGVKFPAYMDQIDFPYFTMFSKPKPVPPKKVIYVDDVPREKELKKGKENEGVFLGFLPVLEKDVFDDDVIEKLKVYILNQNDEDYNFTYNLIFSGVPGFRLKNTVERHTQFYLHDVQFEDLNDNPRFEFVFELKKPQRRKAEYIEKVIKLKAKLLFKKINEVLENGQATFAYELFFDFPDRVEGEKLDLIKLKERGISVIDSKDFSKKLPPARSVVDLHIDKLTDKYENLKPAQILEMQESAFEKYYNLAVAHGLPKFTVIHGIGNGTLRKLIHEKLKSKKEVKSFINQLHGQFGYGATEIYFKS